MPRDPQPQAHTNQAGTRADHGSAASCIADFVGPWGGRACQYRPARSLLGVVENEAPTTRVARRPVPGSDGDRLTRYGRLMTLTGWAADYAEELAEHLGPVGEADAWVFTADQGGVLRPSNFRVKAWLPAVRAAGLAPLRPHDLRHTAVALWIAARANPKEVSVRAGHTSVAFTLDRYGHLFEGHDDELRDRLDAMHAQGLQAVPGGELLELPAPRRGPPRPQRGPRRSKQ